WPVGALCGVPRRHFGLRWRDDDRSGWEIDPLRAPVVRLMFERAAAGWSRGQIAQELESRGVRPPRASSWSGQAISFILRNPIYVGRAYGFRRAGGRLRPREEWVPLPEGTAPKLIDEVLFAAAAEAQQHNRQF